MKPGGKLVRIVFGRTGGHVAILLLSLILVHLFAFRGMRFFLVPSASMEPALRANDYIVALKERALRRGDIVVLRDPESPGDYLVKRIVGVGGDVVFVFDGSVFIGGRRALEPYAKEPAEYVMPPVRVPRGEVLVLGDNRNNSDDSHLWKQPCVPVAAIIGRVRFIYSPMDRVGPVKRKQPVLVAPDEQDRLATVLHRGSCIIRACAKS